MKIVYCTDQLYKHGGVERVISLKVNGLIKYADAEISIITYDQCKHKNLYNFDKKVNFFDLDINYKRNLSFFNIINLIKSIKHFIQFKKLISKLKPDVIVSVINGPEYFILPFIKGKTPIIKEFHSSRYFEKTTLKEKNLVKRILHLLFDWVEKKYDCCVVLNKDELAYCKNKNLHVIPNPIEIIDDSSGYSVKSKTAISVGRIEHVKGFDFLIDAWKIVNREYPEWILNIYGEGNKELTKKLLKKISINKLQNNVFLRGSTSNIFEKMRASSFYVLSSRSESFGLVLLEAQSQKIPVIAFDCPTGPRNIINDGVDGLLVKREDINELSSKIIYLIENENVRKIMGKRGFESVQKYKIETIINRWELLFTNLIHK